MRIKLHCKLASKENVLGYNYNRSLSALIYELLRHYDPEYSKSLHDSNQIKGFTFSPIEFSTFKTGKEGITITGKEFNFKVSTSDTILVAALMNASGAKLALDTREGSIRFVVDHVEVAQPVVKTNTFMLASPLVISIKGEDRVEYLAPGDEGYKELLFKNLIKKAGKELSDYKIEDLHFKVITPRPKEKLISHIKGYIYDFTIECPEELVMAGVLNGFGIKNSQGFGYVK